MALVGVEDLGVESQGFQGADTADAEEDLLAQPVLHVAAVEAVGHGTDLVGVVLDVGIEEVERDAPDVGPPHLGLQRLAGQVDPHPDALAQGEGHGPRVLVREALLLPAVERDRPWRK